VGQAETDVDAPDASVAACGTKPPLFNGPGPPAINAPELAQLPGAAVHRSSAVVVVPLILRKLPGIPCHVVQPPRIGLKAIHRRRSLAVVLAAATSALSFEEVVAPVLGRRGSCAGRMLPLRLAGRAARMASLPAQPVQVLRASSQLTLMTGRLLRPQQLSLGCFTALESQA
jgi:hypothetical protein